MASALHAAGAAPSNSLHALVIKPSASAHHSIWDDSLSKRNQPFDVLRLLTLCRYRRAGRRRTNSQGSMRPVVGCLLVLAARCRLILCCCAILSMAACSWPLQICTVKYCSTFMEIKGMFHGRTWDPIASQSCL